MTKTRSIDVITTVAVAATALLPVGHAAAQTGTCAGCDFIPGVDAGIVALPGPCPFSSPSGTPLVISDGLPAGSTIQCDWVVDSFFDITYRIGTDGDPDGQRQSYGALLHLSMQGTGALQGFARDLVVPLQVETETGPTDLGQPVQGFRYDMVLLSGEIFGDPDFDLLRLTAGLANGLPGAGQTTLTALPGGEWQVDSFFDITYRIEFQGAPGSPLEGMGGATESAVDYANNAPGAPPCTIPDPNAGFVAMPLPCPIIGPPFELPLGTPTAALHGDWTVDSFFDIAYRIDPGGGGGGGRVVSYGANAQLHLVGEGDLAGYDRTLALPVQVVHTQGETNPGAPVQSFPTDMLRLEGQLFGDPDFDLLRIQGGGDFGMPSPGHTTLTRALPDGTWTVDSFFDITYRIEFQGAPGSPLRGQGADQVQTGPVQQGSPAPDPIHPFGLAHTPLCGATLTTNTDGHLVVSNIGSSGEDGVCIDLGRAEGWAGEIDLAPPGTIPIEIVALDLVSSNPIAPFDGVDWRVIVDQTDPTTRAWSGDVLGLEPVQVDVTLRLGGQELGVTTLVPPFPETLFSDNYGGGGAGGRIAVRCGRTPSRVDSFFDITYEVAHDVSVAGGPAVSADNVRIDVIAAPDAVAPPLCDTVCLRGGGLTVGGTLVVSGGSLIVHDASHLADGSAHLVGEIAADGRAGLVVSNLGSSGLDGVTIDCPCLPCPPQCLCRPGWELDWGPGLPVGASLFFSTLTSPPPCAPCSLPMGVRLTGVQNGTGVLFDPGSLPFEPPFIRVEARLDGALVDSVLLSPPYPPQFAVGNLGSSGEDGVRVSAVQGDRLDDDCDGDGLFRLMNPIVTEMQLTGSPLGIVGADELRLCIDTDGAGWPDHVEQARVLASNLPGPLRIRDRFDEAPVACPADTNNDGVVDVTDLVNVILAWGSADPTADVNHDGIVDVGDLVQIILAWGPCFGT